MKDHAEFKATTFIKKYGRQPLAQSWFVRGNPTTLMIGATFLALVSLVAFTTSLLARAIARDGIDSNKGPLGFGRPSLGLKYFRIDMAHTKLSAFWLEYTW